MNNRLAIVGCGNMGNAIATSLLEKKAIEDSNLLIIDKFLDRANNLKQKFTLLKTSQDFLELKNYKYIILAIKPQDFKKLSKEIKEKLDSNSIVISIMAGISIDTLKSCLGDFSFVRSMPNLPAQIGRGVSVFYLAKKLDKESEDFINEIFNSFGTSIQVSAEDYINSATAISGSGPGFIYYIISAFIEAGQELGFTQEQATQLAVDTFSGSIEFLNIIQEEPRSLQEKVSSKGGTTESGLLEFEQNNLKTIIKKGILKAYNRSKELS